MKIYERFEKFVERITESSCHYWLGFLDRSGYGYFKINNKTIKAHRAAYKLFKGEIPEGMLVCHSCDNPSCVNPDHLWLGTWKDNSEDMRVKGRSNYTGAKKNYSGHRNPNAKLTQKDREYIKFTYERGLAQELADQFNVCKASILRVVNSKE